MVSFGTGMQKNITDVMRENDVFTSLFVMPQNIDIGEAVSGNVSGVLDDLRASAPALNDSALAAIRTIPGVEIAYPEIRFPVKLRLLGQETKTTLHALPSVMGRYKPFSNLPHGAFFSRDDAPVAVINPKVFDDVNIRLQEPGETVTLSPEDSLKDVRVLPPDSLLGAQIDIVTSVVDVSSMMQNPFSALTQTSTPLKEVTTPLTIVGIREASQMNNWRFDAGLVVPFKTSERIPRIGFESVWDLLDGNLKNGGYNSLYVRAGKMQDVESIQEEIEGMGFGVYSIASELEEMKRVFLIMDAMLGAMGTVALFVAALGIINTMVMSILERTREIGVMKAIGGSEGEIRGIFITEAVCIGLLGGAFGLGLGWVVTRITQFILNRVWMQPQGFDAVDFFYIPLWLVLGAITFAVLVSLLAGLYPATRAARIDPVKALRHD